MAQILKDPTTVAAAALVVEVGVDTLAEGAFAEGVFEGAVAVDAVALELRVMSVEMLELRVVATSVLELVTVTVALLVLLLLGRLLLSSTQPNTAEHRVPASQYTTLNPSVLDTNPLHTENLRPSSQQLSPMVGS